MFKLKTTVMAKNNEQESNARNHIALGTAIVGNIDTNGDIRIDTPPILQ